MVNSGHEESDGGRFQPPPPPLTEGAPPLAAPEDELRCSVPLEKLDGVLPAHQPEEQPLKTRSTPRKLLCLYCDRSFVSANLRQKHVERAHSSKSVRRSGQRKQTATPCAYCDALENTLRELFEHLVQRHRDRYFGCLPCEERFLTQALLSDHLANVHRPPPKAPPPEEVFQEKEVVIKITRSRVKPRQEEVAEEAKANKAKGKKLGVKSSRMALKKRESKRLQALAKVADNAKKKRAKPERKQLAEGRTEQPNSTKNEKAKAGANPYPEFDNYYRMKKITDHSIDNLKISSLTFDDVFDKAFFNRIKCNIEENLLHHIDGKLFKNEESESRISNFEKVSNATQEVQNANSDNYGCELSLNAVTPVAALSLNSQFGEDFESQIEYGSKPSKKKTPAKTDQVFHYKYFTRRKFQASILQQKENRDLSKLDMWTQLVIKRRQQKILDDKKTPKEMQEYASCAEYKSEVKREELNRILDRRGPFEDLKEEASKKAALDKLNSASPERISHESFTEVREVLDDILARVFAAVGGSDADVVQEAAVDARREDVRELPSYLNLRRTSALPSDGDVDRSDRIALICSSQETENYELPTNQARPRDEPVELSGEWARCRMYVCAACAAKLPNMKYLLDHKSLYHQNVWVQHYEFVGNQNELYRHLSIPALGKVGFIEDNFQSRNWKRSEARSCTKCGKQCNSLGELHRHILECGGDWSWMMARKKCKYRPCKSRRKRLRGLVHRIRHKEKDGPTEKKKYKKAFEGPRQRPSDAETIQRMLANLPAKRSTRKLISLYDGVYRARKSNQIQPQKNQKKVKCGKVIYKSNNIKENTEKTINTAPSVLKTQKPSQSSNRRSLRNMGRVLSSRILDTNANLNVKRKLKAMGGQRSTRQSVQAEVGVEQAAASEEADHGKRKLSDQDSVIHKRTSPRSVPKNMKMMNMKKLMAGNISMKSFFPVKKQKNRKEKIVDAKAKTKRKSNEPESVSVTKVVKPGKEEELKATKGSALKKIVSTLSLKKKPDAQPQSSLTNDANPVAGDKSGENKRKLKRNFRNVINRVKRLKIDSAPESPKIDTKEIDSKITFLGEAKLEHRNQSVRIVIPSNSEAKENLADISESAHIATNFNKASGDSPVPENIFKLGTNDEKSLQAKGDLDFDSQQVSDSKSTTFTEIKEKKTETEICPAKNKKIEPLTIETSEKLKIVPLVSPNVKGKIKKPARGLNDCIAMLTSKLQQKTNEPIAKAAVFSSVFPSSAPKILTDPAPQKSDCILKIPTFKSQQDQPAGLEETALDLTVKPKDKQHGSVGVATKHYFEPLSFSLRPANSVERIINGVIENNFQKESHHKIWKTWNAVDETIQCVIDGCDGKIPEVALNVSKNSVDDIIDFVATYNEDNNNKLSLILKQPGDRLKLKTAKKSKKIEAAPIPENISSPIFEDIPRKNEGHLLVSNPSGPEVNSSSEVTVDGPNNLDATIECVIKNSSFAVVDPVAKSSVKKLSQFRRNKDKKKNGAHLPEKLFVETHLDDVLDTSVVDCKPEVSTSSFGIQPEEPKTEKLALAHEDEPHVLENKVVVRPPSDSEDDIPLAALVKPIEASKNEVIEPSVPAEECLEELKEIEEVAETRVGTGSGSIEEQTEEVRLSLASEAHLESTPGLSIKEDIGSEESAKSINDNVVITVANETFKISEDPDSAMKEIHTEVSSLTPHQVIDNLVKASDSKVPVPNSKKSRNKKRPLSKKKPRRKVEIEIDVVSGSLQNIVDETDSIQKPRPQPDISTISDEMPLKELTIKTPEDVEKITREESIPLSLPTLVDETTEEIKTDVIPNQEETSDSSLVKVLPFANEALLPDVLSVPKRKRAKKTKFSRRKTKKKNTITLVDIPGDISKTTEICEPLEKREPTDLCDTSEETSTSVLANASMEKCPVDDIILTEKTPEDRGSKITTEEDDSAHSSSISGSTNGVGLDSVTASVDALVTETKIKPKKNHRRSGSLGGDNGRGVISEASDIENSIRDLEIRLSDTTEHSFKIPVSDDSMLSDGSKPKNSKRKVTRSRTKTIKRSRSLKTDLGVSSGDESSVSLVELRSRPLKKHYREPSSDDSLVEEPTTLDSDALLSEAPSKSDKEEESIKDHTSADIISETLTTLRKELGLPSDNSRSEEVPPKRSARLSGIAPGSQAETQKATVADSVFKTPTKKKKCRKTPLVVSTDESDLNENSDLSNSEETPDKKSLRSIFNRLTSESDLEESSQSDTSFKTRTRGGSRTALKEPSSNETQREDAKVSNTVEKVIKTRKVSKKRCKPTNSSTSIPSATLNESIESTGNSESSDSDFVDVHLRRPLRKSKSVKTDTPKSLLNDTETAGKEVENEENEETRKPKRSSRLSNIDVKADELPTKEELKASRSNGKHEAPQDVSIESVDTTGEIHQTGLGRDPVVENSTQRQNSRSLRRKLAINYSEIEENSVVLPRSPLMPDQMSETENVQSGDEKTDERAIKKQSQGAKVSSKKSNENKKNIFDTLDSPEKIETSKPPSENEIKIEAPAVVLATPPETNEEKDAEPPIKIVINKQKARRKSKSIKKIDSKGHNDLFEDFALVIKKKRTTPFMSFSPPDTFSREDKDTYPLFLPQPLATQQASDEKDLSNEEVEDMAELDVSVEEMDMELDEIPINASIIENTLNLSLPVEKPNEANDLTLSFEPPVEEIKPLSKVVNSSKNKTRNGRKSKNFRNRKSRQLSSENDTESELENSAESADIPEVPEQKYEEEFQAIVEEPILMKITAKTTNKQGMIEECAEFENPAMLKVEAPEKSIIEVLKRTDHEKLLCPEFDSPTMPHMDIEIKKDMLVGEKLYALMKNPTDVEKPKTVKKTAKKVKGKTIKEKAEFDNPALPLMKHVEMDTFIGNTLDEIEVEKPKNGKGKSMEGFAEVNIQNAENAIEKDVLVEEKSDEIVEDPKDAEHTKTEEKVSKKAKGKSAKECVEHDLPVLPHVMITTDPSVEKDSEEVLKNPRTVKMTSNKAESGVEPTTSDIPSLPHSENKMERNLISFEDDKNLITVKQSSKKFKENAEFDIPQLHVENTTENGLSSEEEFDRIVQNSINNENTRKAKRGSSKKSKRKSTEEHGVFDSTSSSPIKNTMEDTLFTVAEKQKTIKKANRKCKGRLKDDTTTDEKIAETSMSGTETFIELDSKPKEKSTEVLRSEKEHASPSTDKLLLNGPKYSNIPPLDDKDHPRSPKRDKDIDLIYAFSETEDVEINTPIELPRRLPRNVDKTSSVVDDPVQKEDEQKTKKKQKKASPLENGDDDKATGTGEVKENGIDLEENGRRKPMRSAKVKALEYIHDDALAELTESQRNREQKTSKVTQNGSETTIENTNKKNKKQKKNQMAPEVIENATISYEALAEDEAPLLAELVAELHGLEELENSIERELNADMNGRDKLMDSSETKDRTVEEPALEESTPNIGSEAAFEENQELRRSRRGSRKIASYNENDLIDPIIDALENKRNAKKKDTKAANVENKNLKKTKEAEKKLNSDQLFDLLKASTAENSFVPKQQNSFLNNLEDKDSDKIYDFNESSVTTEPVTMNKSLIVSKQSDESSLSSSSYKLLTPDIQDSSTSEESKPEQVTVIESNYCDICNKSFIRVENLVKHRRTLTHIQKLSEIEAKEAELKLQQEQTAPELPTTFTNTNSLKLADIISDVLNKPVLVEEASKFPDIVKRYKSLGERKSFESESTPPQSEPRPFESRTTILEKQISLLEDIIENKGNASYIDDISTSSEDSVVSSKRVATPKNDSAKTLGDDSFLKPTQYEEISEDSANLRNYEDQKLRKTLNRDEELFLECCSLLKSGSEVSSSYSNKKLPHKDLGSVNVRQVDWPQKKNPVSKPELDLDDDYSDDNSRIPTPLGDSFDDDASNSNTISSNWGINDCAKEDGSTRTDFQGISAEKRDSEEDRSPAKETAAEAKHEEPDSKKIITKGARKVFEGLKVSIPTEELNLEEVLNCSPKPRKPEVPMGADALSSPTLSKPAKNARKSKPVKKSQVGSNLLFKVNKKKLLSPSAISQPGSEKQDKSFDVYDFEETQDNTEVFTKPDYKAFRSTKTGDSETESTDPLEPSSTSPAKKPKDQENITKKKCMIMGRIFRNAAKPKMEDIDEEIRTIPAMDEGELVQNYVASCPKLSENEMNQLFDELLDAKAAKASKARKPEPKRRPKVKGKKRARANSESTDDEFSLGTSKRRSGKRSGKEEDNCINLEQELKECIGVASRKSQRSCTSGKQNVLVEYWSSDDSQFEAMLEKQVIAKRSPPAEEEKPLPAAEAAKPKKPPHKRKSAEGKQPLDAEAASNRRKRAAANPLYHWSSSSEDEAGDLIEVDLRGQAEDGEERPVQHGWIVGESPKKLVMMLAQAKGKKTDVDCVKEQGRKRSGAVS